MAQACAAFRIMGRSATVWTAGTDAAVIAKALVESRWWPVLLVGDPLSGIAFGLAWWQPGREASERTATPRRSLLPKQIELEVEARDFVGRPTRDDGTAPSPELNWSRDTERWFRAEGMATRADIRDLAVTLAQKDFSASSYAREPVGHHHTCGTVRSVLVQLSETRRDIEAQRAGKAG